MKILHVVDSGGIYGKEQVIINLVKEQIKEHEPRVFVTGKKDLVEALRGEVEVWFLDSSKEMINTVLSSDLMTDVIHLHGYKESILLSKEKFIGRLRTPLVRTLHGYTSKGKPLFSKIRLYEALDRISLGFHDGVVGVSNNMACDTVIKNGIEEFSPNPTNVVRHFRINMVNHNFIIGCAARLSPEKNLESLINAMHILAERRREIRSLTPVEENTQYMGIKLYIFGDGRDMADLKELVRRGGLEPERGTLDEVHLMGYTTNVKDYLGSLDVYIQPSLTEGTPISVLEAMAAHQFTITSKVGGMKYLVERGATAACGTTPEAIADSIIENSRLFSVRSAHIQNAHHLFATEYSSEVMAKQYLEVYKKVIKG